MCALKLVIDRHRHQLRQRLAAEAEIQRRRLVAAAVAIRADRVVAIAAEQHADVHLVALRLEPIEEALHAVPQPVVRQVPRPTRRAFSP